MAAFSFPQNPQDGATETNPATGIVYVFKALPSPGKWEVQMQSADEDYVNVTGDTMTGPLAITPSSTIPDSTRQSTLMLKASDFTQDPGNETYISRVFEAKTNQDHPIFGIRNSDATNLPITQGRLSSITAYAADFLAQPSLNSITADDFPHSGLRAGFRIGGRQQGGANGNVLDCTYFDTEGTQINYYGDMLTENSLVTKAYVDSAGDGDYLPLTGGEMSGAITFDQTSGDAINVNDGKWKVAFNGVVNQEGGISVNSGNINVASGNITIKSTSSSTGRLYIKNGDDTNLTLFPDGSIQSNTKLTFAGTSNNIIRAYGSASKTLQFKVSSDVTEPTYTDVFSISKSSFTVEGGSGAGTNTSNTVVFTKKRGNDTSDDFVIEGATNDAPTVATGSLLSVHRNGLNDASNADAINYFGRVAGDNNIQTKTSVQDLITDAFSSTDFSIPDNVSFTSLVVTNSITGTSNGEAGNLDIYADILTLPKDGGLQLPDAIQIPSNGTPTLQIPNNRSFFIRSDSKIGTENPIDNLISYVSPTGIAGYKAVYLFGGGVAGSDNPDITGANNQIQFNNATSEYAILQSKGYGQNGYQIFADTSSGTPKKIMNWLLSADGTKGYLNCYYAPQGPNGLVRLSDLTTGVVGSVNTYSVSGGEEGSDEATYHVSNHNIPGQCSFEGLQGAGAGFNLIGRTADQPTNPSAVLLRASHFSSAAAQVEYFGDTTGTDNCLQTKASVAAAIAAGASAAVNNSTLYGTTSIVNGADGSSAQFRIRNANNNGDTYKINNDGSVNAYGGSYNFIGAAHSDVGIASNASNFTDTSLTFYTRLGGTKTAQLKILSNSIFAYKQFNMSSGAQCTGDLSVYAGGNVVIDTGQLLMKTSTGGGIIVMDGSSAATGITVAGNANKTFKVYAGETIGSTVKQVFAVSQTQVMFGTTDTAQTYTYASSGGPTAFNFVESLQLKFNDVVNPITLSQGSIQNVNTLATTSDATGLDLESLGGTNQFVELKGTNSNGDPFTVGKFTATNAYISSELDIYGNTNANTRIYSYGYSRGLEIWAADYQTAKGNSKISAKFEASQVSIDTQYIQWDNAAQGRSPNDSKDLYLRLGYWSETTKYPTIKFEWATATGIEEGMRWEHDHMYDLPKVTLKPAAAGDQMELQPNGQLNMSGTLNFTTFNGASLITANGATTNQLTLRIDGSKGNMTNVDTVFTRTSVTFNAIPQTSKAPTSANHLCNKTYVDNKTVSLQSAIHSAVNSSTDYASLKAALLAALA